MNVNINAKKTQDIILGHSPLGQGTYDILVDLSVAHWRITREDCVLDANGCVSDKDNEKGAKSCSEANESR